MSDEEIEEVDRFTYLGSVLTRAGGADEDVMSRITKANAAFVQLYPVWKARDISTRTKLKIFSSNVKSVLLYGCETWKVSSSLTQKLQVFINRCLRKILKIYWPEVISNRELWKATDKEPVEIQIKKRKWRWIGHTLRKDPDAVERQALSWNPQGHRRRGRPRMTWRRTIEEEIRDAGKNWREVRALAANRVRWRCFVEALCSVQE
ncbi:uncharacterized protein LOC128997645 [Macrosteles quadrilineatus]|uniref:uncharacterized protein LOC128997645 n=1 Tax=Macrosteles quadrilineatus TaxID=74068 RepID=UPI0023E0EA21|nr:uncharacterized protein LOC128997645 [Macrosteles quadrilineatus]